jgi:hypothetical protein
MYKSLRVALPLLALAVAAVMLPRWAGTQNDQPPPEARPRTQFAPYYTVRDGFQSVLRLNNSTRAGYLVAPTLYSLAGKPAQVPPIHLEAHETKEIDLGRWVAALGDEYAAGSIRLDYVGMGFGLGAVVIMMNPGDSLELDVLAQSHQMFKSGRLEGLWWAPDENARVQLVVHNTTEAQVVGNLRLTKADGSEVKSVALELAAHETHVLNLRELVARDDAELGGISIRHNAAPGSLMAQVFVTQSEIGFSANLPLADPGTFGDSKLEGEGVLIGKENIVPAAPEFSGHLLLRNASSDPVTVSTTLQRGDFQKSLAPVLLQPGDAREIIVPPDSLPDRAAGTGIEVKHSGPPGSLVGYWLSLDPSRNLVVETPLRSPAPRPGGGGNYPWSLEGDNSAVIYLKNTGSEHGAVVMSILHAGDQYTMGFRQVKPGETIALDIRKLRDERVPDVEGQVLPLNLLSGQIQWYWRNGPPMIGRVNQMSLSAAIARNMSCGSCCCTPDTVTVSLAPSSSTNSVGGTSQDVAWETDSGCSGTSTFPLPPSQASWGSSNSPVASVNTSGNVSALSPGSATISAIVTTTVLTQGIAGDCEIACDFGPGTSEGDGGENVTPRIDSISPAQGPVGMSVNVTVNGQGFGTTPTIAAGSGITATVNSATDTQIQARFAISGSAAGGNRSVTVTAAGQTSNSVNFLVQIPTSLSIVPGTDSTTTEASCSAGSFGTGCGVTRSFIYQVNDQLGQPVQAAGLQVWDAFGTPSPNNLGITGFTTTCTSAGLTNSGPCNVTTNSVGQFGENRPGLSVCSTVCRVNNACTTGGPTSVGQTWHVGPSSIVQNISFYCDHITVNGQ